jgi:hypothetical protein
VVNRDGEKCNNRHRAGVTVPPFLVGELVLPFPEIGEGTEGEGQFGGVGQLAITFGRNSVSGRAQITRRHVSAAVRSNTPEITGK